MSTIFVTGPSGFVGSHLVPALIGAGHRIVGLARTDETAARDRLEPPERVHLELRMGDVTQPETLGPAMAGVDAVLHLAAIPRDRDGGKSLHRINTLGTRNILEAARAAGVRRFVHQGAMGVADDPHLHYASSKARAEAMVAASDLDWTILKPSLLWGPRDGFFNIIAGLVRYSPGLVPVPGSGSARFQPLWIGDLARIAVRCFEDPATAGRIYDLGGPRIWTYREITQEVLRGMGARRLILPMPVPIIRLVAGTSELLRIPFPVATDQLRQLALDNVGPIDGVRSEFGFEPREMAGQLGYLRRKPRDQRERAA